MTDNVVKIHLHGNTVDMLESDARKFLFMIAVNLIKDPERRKNISRVRQDLLSWTNILRGGYISYLKELDRLKRENEEKPPYRNYDLIEDPFPEVRSAQEELTELLAAYCARRDEMEKEKWEKGWLETIFNQINNLEVKYETLENSAS